MSFFGLSKQKTFKQRNIPQGTKQYQLKKYAEATLGSGNLRLAVQLPEGEDLNEWLAVNTVDFFNQLNMLYGTVTEFCTDQECPIMSAGPRRALPRFQFGSTEFMCRFEYHWQDGVKYKRPTKMSAPGLAPSRFISASPDHTFKGYVDALMNWVQDLLDNEDVFPSKIGVPFPKDFQVTIKSIVRRLFRIYAHLYHHHFAQLCALSIEAHINTSYRHFLLFVNEFDLIDPKELSPLNELNEGILAQ
ncbi:Mob1/phocein [Atractiella rhizophila]|nr:Mob1/phocein [Atractiella rhizophila]